MPTTPLLLIHGAWHDHRQWNDLLPLLLRRNIPATSIDLPGHGEHELPPLPDGRSAHAELTLNEAAHAVLDAAVDRPIVVAHSMSGPVVTRAVEIAPEKFCGVIYLTAFVPVARATASAYLSAPEASKPDSGNIFVADPAEVGAFRINPYSESPEYLDALREAFYTDLELDDLDELRARLSPDLPLSFVSDSPFATREHWGSVPRGFIRCTGDRTLPIALQDLMIREADDFAPSNRFRVREVDASHSPFLSRPAELANLLADLAAEIVRAS